MSVPFEIPDWLLDTSASQAPPDTSEVDPHRIEDLVNHFIAAKQDALFTAPDAYYRTTGRDAVDGAPGILDRLNGLKQAMIDAAGDDGTRAVLAPRLDAHLDDASDGIDRHVAAQRDGLTRQIISERQRLIRNAATLEHNNDDKLADLAEAHASAAQELARMNGEPEEPAMNAARSAIWRTAIDQRLANGNGPQAITLFDQVKNQLATDGHLSLDGPLQVARNDRIADQWIASQAGTDGAPLQDRAAADPNLPPDAKLIVRAKLGAQDSLAESKRVATAKGLDDQIADTIRSLATAPNTYKTGSLFRIARAYDDAGEPDKAAATGRLAAQEAVLLPFAQMSVDKQQRLIDSLPDSELRDAAIAIQHQQADAFARDAFTVGPMQRPLAEGATPRREVIAGRLAAPPNGMREGVGPIPTTADTEGTLSDASPDAIHDGDQIAQTILPFLGKPPYYTPPRPLGPVKGPVQGGAKPPGPELTPGSNPAPTGGAETPRQLKVPIPRQSGKESKNDVPQEYRAIRPYVGETPR